MRVRHRPIGERPEVWSGLEWQVAWEVENFYICPHNKGDNGPGYLALPKCTFEVIQGKEGQ